jgi:hypothetical protein
MNSAHIELEDLGMVDHRAERGLYSWTNALAICQALWPSYVTSLQAESHWQHRAQQYVRA